MSETVRDERQKQRKRTLAAFLGSLLIHLLIILVAFLILSLKPQWLPKLTSPPAPTPTPEPAEFTLVPPPPEPEPPKQKDFVDSSQAVVTEKEPENAAFESDKNTVAASELPPESDAPVPTLRGDEGPGLTLLSQDLSLGPNLQPAAPRPASPNQPAPPKPAEKPREEKPPVKEPPKEAPPAPTPVATPKPMPKPEDDALALLNPDAPRPKPAEPEPEAAKPEPQTPPSRPQPPGFQPQTRVTRLSGGISNAGRSSVAAVSTPLGRYKKMLSDAIGSRWYYYVNDMLDLVGIGTVQLRFVVRADGHVERVQVLKNSSNESLASCSVRSVMEAEIPPIPKEIVGALDGGKLEVDYSFTITGR